MRKVAAAILLLLLLAGTGSASTRQDSVTLLNKTWTCDGPVNIASVSVTITSDTTQGNSVGVLIRKGCTGTIGSITVVNSVDDGIKIGDATNLTIGGGTITCLAHGPLAHQDGIQVTSGENVTIANMVVNCSSANDAAFFVNDIATDNVPAPHNILLVNGFLGGTTSTTAFVTDNQTGSGVVNTTICKSKYFAYRKGKTAIDEGNAYPESCAGAA